MKLKTLAIAIAVGTMPFAAQAELKIGGDITVGYFGDAAGNTELKENGSEINIDASDKVGGNTFYGHTEIDFQETGNAAEFQEVRVGVKGGWGEVILGEADNACDQLDTGGTNDYWLAHTQGGCMGSDVNNIVYKRSMGPATFAVSHNPNGNEYNAVGVQGKMGPATVSLGYEDGDDIGSGGSNVVVGLSAAFGPFAIGVDASSHDSDVAGGDFDAAGMNVAYTAGPNFFYGGFGTTDESGSDVDSWSVGYNRSIGDKTTFVFEAAETDGDSDTSYGVGLQHSF